MKIDIDYQDEDVPTVEMEVIAVPRIGEKVGVRPIEGQPRHFYLDFVVDVRHYPSEIRVLTSSRP